MNTLGDALKDAYAADERSARGLARGPHRTIVAIRRRRTARAAGTGTAAAVAIGALGTVWWLGPGGRVATPAVPMPSGTCADSLYLPPNPAALGDAPIVYRAYVDLRPGSFTHGVVAVTPDGVETRVQPDENGDYSFEGSPIISHDLPDDLLAQPMILDQTDSGGGGAYWDGVSPYLWDYHWTTVIPDDVPAGINTASLSNTLRIATAMGGSGYQTDAVPEGAVTNIVVTTTSGSTGQQLRDGDPMPDLEHTDGLVSVALVVSGLPDGGTFTITSTYGEPDPALTACVVPSTTPSASAVPVPTGTPSASPSSDPGVSQAPGPEPLSGPESAVFECGAPLPPGLEGTLGLDVGWESGVKSYPHPFGGSDVAEDFGGGGVAIVGALPSGGAPGKEPTYPGWAWSQTDTESLAVFTSVVAVKDGVIIGVVPPDLTGIDGVHPPESYNFLGAESEDDPTSLVLRVSDVDARMEPCGGYSDGDRKGADTVALLGTGAVGGPYQFAWTTIERP